MGLERLQSVFNNILENDALLNDSTPSPSIEEIGDDHSYGSNGFFDSINNVLQPDGTYRRLPVINIGTSANSSPLNRELTRSEDERGLTADGLPQIRLGRYATHYSGLENQNGVTLLDSDGTYRQYPGLAERSGENPNIRLRYINGADIGRGGNLGRNSLTLNDIYDTTHGNSYDDKIKLFGQGSTVNLDIRASSKLSGIFGFDEPFIVKPIPDQGGGLIKSGYNRDSIPYGAQADDLLRFGKFYTSDKGLTQLFNENVTNYAIGDSEAFDIPPNPTAGIMAPPIPVPNTGFLNFYQQTLQGVGLVPGAGSLRKPFKIEYSTKVGTVVALATQGDSTFGIEEVEKIKIPEAKTKLGKTIVRGLQKLKDVGIINLEKSTQVPLFERPTSFIKPEFNPLRFDPFTGALEGNESTTVDYINRSRYMDEEKIDLPGFKGNVPPLETDLKNPIKKGDFYVRFKDLRNDKFLYFRGFINGINENINPSYNPTQYIGRSEDVYVYQKAERDLSFNLKVYPQNQVEFDAQYEKINALTSLAYPSYLNDGGNLRMKPPFTEMYMAHIGTRAEGQFGFIKSLTYTVPDGGDWDAFSALPRMFDIAISYQILNRRPPQLGTQFYRGTGEVLTAS